MKRVRIGFVVFSVLLGAALIAEAQGAPGPGGFASRGFSSQQLIAQLSLYLSEEDTKGMARGFGGGPGQGAQGQSAQGQASQGQAAGGRAFPQIQFTRDPKLFLTKDQITKILPVLVALRENPLPTPSKAKQVQADIDSELTAAQKAEWAEFQKKLQDLIAQFRQRMSANANGGQADPGAQAGQAGQAGAAAGAGSGTGPQMTLMQRRQRQLDAFIKVLQDKLKQAST